MARARRTPSPVVAVLFALLSTLAAGCADHAAGATCRREAAPATGPGDVERLFPATVGDLWAYRVTDQTGTWRVRVKVTGPATAGAGGLRFLEEPLGTQAHPRSEASVSVGAGGVTVLESAEWDELSPALRALVGPRLLLRFPVVVGDRFVATDCTGLDAGSQDGDAASDPVDLRSEVEVLFHGAAATPLGERQAYQVETRTDLTVHSSVAGAVSVHGVVDDWYAPGLGLVRSSEVLTGEGAGETSARELFAWSVGGEAHGVAAPRPLAPLAVTAGTVVRDGWQTFQVAVPAGPMLVLGLLGQEGPLSLGGTSGARTPFWSCDTGPTTTAAQCLLPGGAGAVEVDVDGGGLTAGSASFGVVVAPQAVLLSPSDETLALPRGVVTAGHVGTRGRSHYTVTGLTPGVPVTVALLGATGAADLRPAPGTPPDPLSTCWLDWSLVLPGAESCTLTPAGDTAAFDVECGSLNRDGAAYLLVAWSPP